ncbi:MAG TPA: hypothetical protein VHV47_06405 [Opitutaceae bacterium]|jgi:hypothetical protein|nr:hypothetical protein [Opitutaceae bacterium]
MKKYLSLLSIAAPALLVGALSVSSLRSGFSDQVIAGAGQTRLIPQAKLDQVRYAVPTASTPAAVVFGAAALAQGAEYALAETYAVEAAAWLRDEIGG